MNKTQFVSNLTRGFHKFGLQIKKHSPEILVVAGVVGTVASAVMACKATTKASSILEETKEKVEKIHYCAENPDFSENYTEEDVKKDLTIVYTQTGLQLAKTYAPSVLLGLASIGCILTSHGILHKRNTALAAAYAAVDTGFKKYRKRVVERFGEELDKELKYNIKAQEIEETVVNEDGTESTVKKVVQVAGNPTDYSPYSIVFDCGNTGWEDDAELNKYFLLRQQSYANDLLNSKGYLFLNEVYAMLGARPTKSGQVVGWVKNKEQDADHYVDFGILDIHKPKSCDFMNGIEKSIILDFNVDGNILDLI